MTTLYLVGTPIGNLEDISLRALRILKEVTLIAAEDTRTSGRLLKKYQIETPMVSYHDYSGEGRIARLVDHLATGDVALISDAGMPGLSDPGYRLVKAVIEAGIQVVPIPGPTAVISALVSSGLPTDEFLFLGFLPRQAKKRRRILADHARLTSTLVIYEAPHRLPELLVDLVETVGDRQICVAREITKLHEEIWRGSVRQALERFQPESIKGEITVVIGGAKSDQRRWEETAVRAALVDEVKAGVTRKSAVAAVAELSGWRKRDVYELSLELD